MKIQNKFTQEEAVIAEKERNFDKRIWEVMNEEKVGKKALRVEDFEAARRNPKQVKKGESNMMEEVRKFKMSSASIDEDKSIPMIIEGEELENYEIQLWTVVGGKLKAINF